MSFPLKSAIQRKGETDNVGKNVGKDVGKNVGKDVGKNVGKNVGKDVGKNLSPRQLQILELVTENPEISIAEMAK